MRLQKYLRFAGCIVWRFSHDKPPGRNAEKQKENKNIHTSVHRIIIATSFNVVGVLDNIINCAKLAVVSSV